MNYYNKLPYNFNRTPKQKSSLTGYWNKRYSTLSLNGPTYKPYSVPGLLNSKVTLLPSHKSKSGRLSVDISNKF